MKRQNMKDGRRHSVTHKIERRRRMERQTLSKDDTGPPRKVKELIESDSCHDRYGAQNGYLGYLIR